MHLSMRSFSELKASLLLVPYRYTTVQPYFFQEINSDGKLCFPTLLHLLIGWAVTGRPLLQPCLVSELSSSVLLPWSFLSPVHYQLKKTTTHLTANTVATQLHQWANQTPHLISALKMRKTLVTHSTLRSSSDQPCPVPYLSTRLFMLFMLSFFFFFLFPHLNSFYQIPMVTSTTVEDLILHATNSTGSWVWAMSLQVNWKTPIRLSRSLISKSNENISVNQCYYYLNHIMHAIYINIILVYA